MTLRHSISARCSVDSLISKTHPRIKQRVASYHTIKVIAHQRPKPVMANWLPWQRPSAPVDSHLTHDSYGPSELTTQTAYTCISSAVFAQLTTGCAYTLQWAAPSPQNCLFSWQIWTPCNSWSLRPTQVLNPNGISIGSAVFARLTTVTDRQTRQTTLLSL